MDTRPKIRCGTRQDTSKLAGSWIGGGADFAQIWNNPSVPTLGAIRMLIHGVVPPGMCWVVRGPIFFVAVESPVNLGGAATAPVVAPAFYPSLEPVGTLMVVAGEESGAYYRLLHVHLLKVVAGVCETLG